jgi:hypothetical protein
VSKALSLLTLTDGAGGFLRGVPLGFDIVDRHHKSRIPHVSSQLIRNFGVQNPGPGGANKQEGPGQALALIRQISVWTRCAIHSHELN